MKKALLYSLSLALLLSLAACNKPQANQQEPSQPDPATTSTPADVSTPEPVKDTTPEPTANTTPEPISDTIPAVSAEIEDTQPPEDTPPQEPVETELFTDVEETVYATGTVNIRSSWSAESDKLGSLSRGQSVTRTGTSIQGTEAEGWSRVQLSDGSTAYISNKYLSTTKPEVQKPQQNKPSTSTGTSTSGSSNNQQSQTQTEDTSQTPQTSPNTDQPKLSTKERVENSEAFKNLQKKFPGTWVDEHGNIHSPAFDGDSGDIMG